MRIRYPYPEFDITKGEIPEIKHLQLFIRGHVQGVGFRPFVFRLASELGLAGYVCNSPEGVHIEIEGAAECLKLFMDRLETQTPPHALIQNCEFTFLKVVGYSGFTVRRSPDSGQISTPVLPDLGTCPECLSDIYDPDNRRYRYPFTNCTNCGPRYSIVESLPYDRDRTTMKKFLMCDRCRAEYEDPRNRRFHAQPNACPRCGPHLELWDTTGKVLALHGGALREAADIIRKGEILALKGLGGFQLLVDAAKDAAVMRLRRRKAREEKPLALMYPDLDSVQRDCLVAPLEERLLQSSESPIVLLARKADVGSISADIAESVAPDNPYLGIMLPYTPLHHLLMNDLGFPVVATSGNISDEPICIDEYEALDRLRNIADMFLVHDRPIVRQVDDSVVQVMGGRGQVLRSARGYSPVCIDLNKTSNTCLAAGAHQKNSIAIAARGLAFISQHVGDLETPQAYEAFTKTIHSLSDLYESDPEMVACDLHPDYASTIYAAQLGKPIIHVQHHYAHVLSCMADSGIDGPVLGIAWDGTGLGTDGTIWGGEFLHVDKVSFSRRAYFMTFRLPGNESAVREPRRSAVGMLYEIFGDGLFQREDIEPLLNYSDNDRQILQQMLQKRINCPVTSSVGRIFDAVASILNICHINTFNGQAAMMLGYAAASVETDDAYHFDLTESEDGYGIDWEPMMRTILKDNKLSDGVNIIAAKFHNTLVEMMVAVAKRVGEKRIVLTGGCFQNRYLSERAIHRLRASGFTPFWHHRIPPNDGGIALGQIMAASRNQNGDE